MIAIISIRINDLKPEEIQTLTEQVQIMADAYNTKEHSIMILPNPKPINVNQVTSTEKG